MFNLGKNNKNPMPGYSFDIENDLKDPSKKGAIFEQLESRIQELKQMLRSGDDKEQFENIQTLMHGYLARQRVLNRVGKKLGEFYGR